MLLGRLRVRQKLALLVLPLLVLVVIGAVPLVAARVDAAERSSRAADVVRRAVRIGELVQELQQERLASLGYLAGLERRDRVVARAARVLDLGEQLSADYGGGDDRLDSALRAVSNRSSLEGVRIQVLGERATGLVVYIGFTEAIDDLIAVLDLGGGVDLRTDLGRKQLALDSIIRHDEATAAAGAALFIEPERQVTPRVIALVSAGQAVEDREERVFVPLADAATVELYEDVEGGQSSRQVSDYFDRVVQLPVESLNAFEVDAELLPRVGSLTEQSRLVETLAAAQAVRSADDSRRRDRWLATVGIALALVLLIGAGVLSVLVARSIARPLRRLTASADEVADVAQQELVRVADTDDPEEATPRLRPVRVGTSDELGELAQAFNRVQQVAADLVERQVASRRNVATMFGNVGRRTQNLVGRQLAMIDSLERNEQDPVLLDRLYRLDHVSTRLRRNANSLVVLSGAVDPEMTGEPLSVADTIRSALGEIEGFQRVRLGPIQPVLLTPHVTPDVILLLAELLENGTSFSPPNTEVEVGASLVDDGSVLIRIVDHGLGMTAEQLAAENARLVERERLDMAPTDVLGLFVVGRLARRHGIRVTLLPTPGSGVTAEVLVPAGMVVGSAAAPTPVPAPSPVPAVVGAGPGLVPAPPVEEGARGWWEPPRVPVGPPAQGPAEGPAARPPDRPDAGPAPAEPPSQAPAEAPGLPEGPGRIRRRVRGAQLPDTGPAGVPDLPGDAVQPADESRQSIEDFEEGVRRAQQESATQRDGEGQLRRNGRLRPVRGSGATPVPPLTVPGGSAPTDPAPVGPAPGGPPVDPARALVEEFEDGVRRALARLELVSGSGGWPLFERPNGNGAHAAPPAAGRGAGSGTPGADDAVPPPRSAPPAVAQGPAEFRPSGAGPVGSAPGQAPAEFSPPAAAPGTGPVRPELPAVEPGAATTAPGPAGPAQPGSPGEATGLAGAQAEDRAAWVGPGPTGPMPPITGGPAGPPEGGEAGPEPGRAQPAEAPATGPGRGLARRVPGAQLPPGARAARPGSGPQEPATSADAAVEEAAAARALVEEFEAGVKRALQADGSVGPTGETSEEGTR